MSFISVLNQRLKTNLSDDQLAETITDLAENFILSEADKSNPDDIDLGLNDDQQAILFTLLGWNLLPKQAAK